MKQTRQNNNNKYLYTTDSSDDNILNYNSFCDNDTIIIESTTGTGKTTAIASHLYEYTKTNNNMKF